MPVQRRPLLARNRQAPITDHVDRWIDQPRDNDDFTMPARLVATDLFYAFPPLPIKPRAVRDDVRHREWLALQIRIPNEVFGRREMAQIIT
jgi:hypothetical protein